ncbi:putative integral membrane protein [Aspergillus niger]|uniref:Putative integral membrane protein n=1 Tax=Aspergillus niger TaxID=5061 RepID=A0A505IGA4_ASPNG|nr:putative integral membrane protein [Aspergillus niger]
MHDYSKLGRDFNSAIESDSITTGMLWMKEELVHQKNPILVPIDPGPTKSVSIKLTTYNPPHKSSVENFVCTSIRNPFNTPGSESNYMQDVKGMSSVL